MISDVQQVPYGGVSFGFCSNTADLPPGTSDGSRYASGSSRGGRCSAQSRADGRRRRKRASKKEGTSRLHSVETKALLKLTQWLLDGLLNVIGKGFQPATFIGDCGQVAEFSAHRGNIYSKRIQLPVKVFPDLDDFLSRNILQVLRPCLLQSKKDVGLDTRGALVGFGPSGA